MVIIGIGYSHLHKQEFLNSILFFQKSIELNDGHPASHYNLAYAYLNIDEKEKAISSAVKAMELYDYPEFKADAARMIAVIYEELDNKEKAIEYFKLSNEIEPENYYTLKPLLFLELHTNSESYKSRTNEFFLLAPDNPTIYQNLMEIYWQNDKKNELIDFFTSKICDYNEDFAIKGSLYFFLGNYYYSMNEDIEAKNYFEKARKEFAKVFAKEHYVFEVIDAYIN